MIYFAEFNNTENTLYKIEININGGNNTTKEIILAPNNAFTIEYSEGNTIYSPLKLINASTTLITNEYMFNIFSAKAKDVKVTFKNITENKIEFVGYATPCLYSQSFEQEFEEMTLEMIDGISVLNNYNYKTIESENKKIKSLEEIIIHIIKQTECYSTIYINKNLSLLDSIDKSKIIDKLFISEQNFYTDENEGDTYKNILESIMQFLGYTLIPFGDAIYIIDYDYIKNDNTEYKKYSTLNNWTTYTTEDITLSHNYLINTDSFKANGGQIDLLPVYNQISIKTSEYKTDSLLPQIFNDEILTNISHSSKNWNNYVSVVKGDYMYLFKYLENPNYKTFHYSSDYPFTEIAQPEVINYNYTATQIGCTLMKMSNFKVIDGAPATINYSNYICMHRHLKAQSAYTDGSHYLRNVDKGNKIPEASYMYDDFYLVINGQFYLDSKDNECYIKDDQTKFRNDIIVTDNELSVKAKLRIGNKYWNGSIWTTEDTTFYIMYDRGDEKHLYYSWFPIKNTVNFAENINIEGQKIPIKKTDKLIGDVYFTLYIQKVAQLDYRLDCVWLKDFKIDLVKPIHTKNHETDTEYINIINTDFIEELSEITNTLCTDTNKGLSYSTVIAKPNDTIGFINCENVFDKSLNINQKHEYNNIQKHVMQYSTPKKKLSFTLSNIFKPYSLLTIPIFANDKYIIDSISINYFNNNAQLSIVQKS